MTVVEWCVTGLWLKAGCAAEQPTMHGTTDDYLDQVLNAKFGRSWCVSCREKERVSRKHLPNLDHGAQLCEQAEHTEHFQWVNNLICKLLLLFSCLVMSDSFATPQTVVCLAPLSMGFPRQEYWSGLQFPSPGDLPDPGIKSESPACRQILHH